MEISDIKYSNLRSMTDLVTDSASAQSPKRKFSFRFPHYLAHHSASVDKDATIGSPSSQHHNKSIQSSNKTRNFSEEVKNVPDLQVISVFHLDSAQCARFHNKLGVYRFFGLKIRCNYFYFILVETFIVSRK